MLSPVLLCHQAFLVRVSIRFKTPPLGGSSRLSKVAFCFLLLTTRTLYLGRLLSSQRYRLLLVRTRVIQRRRIFSFITNNCSSFLVFVFNFHFIHRAMQRRRIVPGPVVVRIHGRLYYAPPPPKTRFEKRRFRRRRSVRHHGSENHRSHPSRSVFSLDAVMRVNTNREEVLMSNSSLIYGLKSLKCLQKLKMSQML